MNDENNDRSDSNKNNQIHSSETHIKKSSSSHHFPPVIVQETDDEDDLLSQQQVAAASSSSTAIPFLEIDEETMNSGAEGCVLVLLLSSFFLLSLSDTALHSYITHYTFTHIQHTHIQHTHTHTLMIIDSHRHKYSSIILVVSLTRMMT